MEALNEYQTHTAIIVKQLYAGKVIQNQQVPYDMNVRRNDVYDGI